MSRVYYAYVGCILKTDVVKTHHLIVLNHKTSCTRLIRGRGITERAGRVTTLVRGENIPLKSKISGLLYRNLVTNSPKKNRDVGVPE